ncbi:MAG: GDP-L-fucose synthase [Patescibacteria group bacterium]
MDKNAKIFVAGHNGLVGSAIVRALKRSGFENIVTRSRSELDLLDEHATAAFFEKESPDYVFDAAARVGGIMANKNNPADFIRENLVVQNNLIHQAYLHKTKKLLFLGSSCIYPRLAEQPIREEYLLTGDLEPTNKAYAIAKIAGVIMVESYNKQYGTDFISVMPTNLYGTNDNFDLENSHVLPALIRKFHDAKKNGTPSITLWGSGEVYREFLHVDDLADACVFLMNAYSGSMPLNIGTGEDVTIRELANMIKDVVGYSGDIVWDTSKPDGTPRKLLNVDRVKALGWAPKIGLREGVESTYQWFVENIDSVRGGSAS